MITKVEDTQLIQKCVCGSLHAHAYSALSISTSFISLPACGDCGSLEVLHNNNQNDVHSLAVSKVFAKVATQG
jgi:hypothetical protein